MRHGADVRKDMCCCPFHSDDTPSLHFYDGGRKWHCFGCGEGGNAIDAVMLFDELSFIEALRQLDGDYRLGLFADADQDPARIRRRTSVYTEAARQAEEYRQIRRDALQGYYYYDAILRKYKAPAFANRQEEAGFWDAVSKREACERVYEELADFKI